MLLILTQGCLLVFRSLLTDAISGQEGAAGGSLINQKINKFLVHLAKFALIAVPASFVNSGLKYFQKLIELSFREKLGVHLHAKYMEGRCYYQASSFLGITNIDQRLTEDVEKFSVSISELYNHTLKPLLDVVLFTRSLSKVMGYKTQFLLYGYYVGVGVLLKSISPPLALMAAQETGLSGNLRGAHHRLVEKSEEIGYNDPPGGSTEQLILNGHLRRLLKYSEMSSFQKFVQQIADQYLIKYGASVIALFVYAFPFFMSMNNPSKETRTKEYIRSMRLLQNASRGVGDLILVYKRVTRLAGSTSRVAELMEEIEAMQLADNPQKNFYGWEHMPDIYKNVERQSQITEGDEISCEEVSLYSPDGTNLVRDLSFTLSKGGDSVLIVGPNGSGKSSLIRVLAGLWPLAQGQITKPSKGVFFLSQRPYMVAGSLRDQLLYPNPSSSTLANASKADGSVARRASRNCPMIRDKDMKDMLEKVDLGYLLDRYSLNDSINWEDTLSGGEKQRIAMARLLCHKPNYAILDECTSAVSADGEQKLYEMLAKEDISFLSIAHRPGVRKYHQKILSFDGSLQGSGWSMTS